MITKDVLAIHLVVDGNEFLILASIPLGVATSVNAVKHFIGLRHPMPDEVEAQLEDVLYGDTPDKTATWKAGDRIFVFNRTTLVTEE